MKDLEGLHVLVTRPNPAGAELCALIAEHGGMATHLPTIAFSAQEDVNGFKQAIKLIGEQDWLIFVSPQAVYASIAAIRRDWPHFPPQLKLAAIGAGTVKALKEAGYQSVVCPAEEWNSEGLLNLPEFQLIKGKKVMLVRGNGGREKLQLELSEREAIVSHLVAYQRVLPNLDMSEPKAHLAKQQIDLIICMSFEAVNHLKILFGEQAWPDLQRVPLIVNSDRIKELAQNLGFQTIWVISNPSHAAVIEGIKLCQMYQKKPI